MSKKRKSDRHLPPNVYIKHNAYYFVERIPKKKPIWHWLAQVPHVGEAMAAWTKIINPTRRIHTMNQLFDRYMVEVAPTKAPATYKANILQVASLRIWFGSMQPDEITPVDIYKYIDTRAIKAPVAANREKALLSHCFSMAIRWGIIRDNPCKNVKRITERPRERYIEDEEYLAFQSICSPLVIYMMDFAYFTGQRKGDILSIKLTDIVEEGIKIEQNKTGAKILISWTDKLRECVSNIRKLPRSNVYSLTLFCNRNGAPLTSDGFSSVWDRLMIKALEQGLIKQKFRFNDIRAKSASDAKNVSQASELLGHTDSRITQRVYIRNHKKVTPIK